MKKRHRNYIIFFVIFILGVALGIQATNKGLDDSILSYEEVLKNEEIMPFPISNINNNVINKLAKLIDKVIKKSFEYGIKGISNIFKYILGL